jgi:hypothetical protein
MMDHSTIWMAVDLMQAPSRVKLVRTAPLPSDVSTLMRIAAGDEEVMREAVAATGRPHATVREAAAFYIEQILLYPDADSYRVLGARHDASNAELRRNMALLIRWLHPDQQNRSERSVFTTRVTKAWNELKTDEKRAAYDQSRRSALINKSLFRKKQTAQKGPSGSRASQNGGALRMHPISRHHVGHHPHHSGILKRVLLMLFGRGLH